MFISWKNSFLLLFYLFFSHLLLTVVRSVVAVTRTSAAGHPLHQAFSFHSFAISFHFFQGFLFFDFFYDIVFFVFAFWCPSLFLFFSLFLSSLRVSNCFVFPLFKQKISSCFISSFSICSCSDSFSMSSSFFQLLLFHLFWNLFFSPKTLVTPFRVLVFLYFLKNMFLCFSFCSLVCSLFPLLTMFFVTFFRLSSVPSLFFKKKSLFWSPFGFFKKKILSLFSILLSFKNCSPRFSLFLVRVFLFFHPKKLFALCHALFFFFFVCFLFQQKTTFSTLFYLPFLITF